MTDLTEEQHYQEALRRHLRQPNVVFCRGGIGVLLIKRKQEIREIIFDWTDLPLVTSYKWYLSQSGKSFYVCCRDKTQNFQVTYLHRVLYGLDRADPRTVDHEDGNTLNYQRYNLRLITKAQNNQNVWRTKHRGTCWCKKRLKWIAQLSITVKGKRTCKHVGLFDTQEEAALAASEARKIYLPYSNEARKT
jgi:hypothetical protein